jgi:hypothetical protein
MIEALIDAVAGSWRYRDGAVRPEPFAPLTRSARANVDAEAERLSAFHA